MHGLDILTANELDNVNATRAHVLNPGLIGTVADQFLLAEIESSVGARVGAKIVQVSRDHYSGLMAYQDIRGSLASHTAEELRVALELVLFT